MAYRLKSNESVVEGLRRVVCEELEYAATHLESEDTAKRDEAIHEARKSVKKVRAVLRLVKTDLGRKFKKENRRLRDAGRELSNFRDAGVMIETFDAVIAKYPGDLDGHTFQTVRRALAERKQQHETSGEIERVVAGVAQTLRGIMGEVDSWPLQDGGFDVIAPGLEETYRDGRKALASAKKHPRAENYHEWRKRVKDHWYHVRLLENIWADKGYEKSLKDLETWLGEDHNLVLLREKIAAEPEFYGAQNLDLLFELVGKFQKELRDNALSRGEQIYEEKPGQFSRRVGHLWDAWQLQPATS